MRTAATWILLSAAALSASAQESNRTETLRRLKSVQVSVDFRNLPLSDALDELREATGLNLVLDAGADGREKRVTLRLRNVGAGSALRLMLEPMELSFAFRHGAIVVAPPGRFPDRTGLEIYDVKSLVYGIHDFPGVSIALDSGAGVVFG